MNVDNAILAEADLPHPDPKGHPNGYPAGDEVARGLGREDASDPGAAASHLAVLDRLGDVGVALAEQLPPLARAQAQLAEAVTERLRSTRPDGIAALGELAVTLHRGNVDFASMYERICRSVRRCIAMHMQLASGSLRARAAGARDAAPRPRPSSDSEARAERGRRSASERPSETESGISAGLAGELEPERLLGDLYDRPEDPTGMADLGLDRPMKELVARICADFGVDGKIWAERLGIGEEASTGPAAGAKHPHSGRRPRKAGEYEMVTVPKMPPTAPLVTADHARPPRDGPITDDPRSRTEVGARARNRRERRAALKLARRSAPAANRRQPESGRGPP